MNMNESMARGLSAAVIFAAATGCAPADEPELGTSEHALTCPPLEEPDLDPMRSLAVTDPTVLAKFRFHRVMNAIMASANATNNSLSTYRSWMNTFDDCLDPQGYGIRCDRTELTLSEINPFSTSTTDPRFVPIALTNRFDLAPKSGANCGEYRIIFALLGSPLVGDPTRSDRAFLIFEGRLSNPTPSLGLDGCTPVADFWASLSTDPSASSRATKLEQFYFTGLVADGVTFAPVIAAQSYGLASDGSPSASGQIRTNMFVDFAQWNLREFKLTKACAATAACELSFQQVKVKLNPANELFAGTHFNAAAFQSEFPSEVAALSSGTAATITMSTRNVFNEFESVSQDINVVYRLWATAELRSRIQGAITNPALTVDNILDRATTQTCAGCHQLSNDRDLGGGVKWPRSVLSGGFVHIDENGTLSPALIDVFLPSRRKQLVDFLDRRCNGAPLPADDGLTVSGAALDSPN